MVSKFRPAVLLASKAGGQERNRMNRFQAQKDPNVSIQSGSKDLEQQVDYQWLSRQHASGC